MSVSEEPVGRGSTRFALSLAVLATLLPRLPEVVADPDLWWHLHTGLRIVDAGALPAVDDLSFTASGRTWTNHEWLTDVVLAAAFRAGGNLGLLALRDAAFLSVGAGLALALYHRVRSPLLVFFCLAPTVAAIEVFMNLRGHLATAALLVWTLVALDRVANGKVLWLAVPPVAMCAWVNLHGGFLLGMGFVGIALLGMGAGVGGAEPIRRGPLLAAGLATAAAALLNPYGPWLFAYLSQELGASHEGITEWARPDAAQAAYLVAYVAFPLALWVGGGERSRVLSAVMLVGCAALTIVHARMFLFVAIFAALVAAEGLGALVRRLETGGSAPEARGSTAPTPRWVAWLMSPGVSVVVLGAVTALTVSVAGVRVARGDVGVTVDPEFAPIRAVQWLKTERLGPHLGLPLHWGGYVLWHLAPEYRVAVDGRNLTVYDGAWVDAYVRGYREGRGSDVLADYRVDAWLVETNGKQAETLRAQGWSDAYRDELASVLVRASVPMRVGPPAPEPPVPFP